MQQRLVLVGGGGHAKEVAEVADLIGYAILGHVADAAGTVNVPYLGEFGWLAANRASFDVAIIAFGAVNRHGLKCRSEAIASLEKVGIPFATLISPYARLAAGAVVGPGTYVGHNAVINPAARVGRHVIVNTAAVLSHDTVVGDESVIAPGAFLAGDSTVGKGSLIGPGAQILHKRSVGAGVLVAAGAIVLNDLGDGMKLYSSQVRQDANTGNGPLATTENAR